MSESHSSRAEQTPGVWLVSYEYGGSDHVIPFPTEIEALRFVNGESSHRAWFVPFGASFHDVFHGRADAIAHDLAARDVRYRAESGRYDCQIVPVFEEGR